MPEVRIKCPLPSKTIDAGLAVLKVRGVVVTMSSNMLMVTVDPVGTTAVLLRAAINVGNVLYP